MRLSPETTVFCSWQVLHRVIYRIARRILMLLSSTSLWLTSAEIQRYFLAPDSNIQSMLQWYRDACCSMGALLANYELIAQQITLRVFLVCAANPCRMTEVAK